MRLCPLSFLGTVFSLEQQANSTGKGPCCNQVNMAGQQKRKHQDAPWELMPTAPDLVWGEDLLSTTQVQQGARSN
jgi:hypothetical protein